MSEHLVKTDATCPTCGKTMDGATNAAEVLGGKPPRAGDLSVCLYCATLLVFTIGKRGMLGSMAAQVFGSKEPLTVRELSPAEVEALPAKTRNALHKARDLVVELHRKVRR